MKIFLLTDYKGHFSYKYLSVPYRSGMDLNRLSLCLKKHGYEAEYLRFCDVDFRRINLKDQLVLYTSSEDVNSFYKSYIEDICYGLETQGAYLIPAFKFLKAHNNKVFMEILRDLTENQPIKSIKGQYYGCVEELILHADRYEGRTVIKGAEGAKSNKVLLADNPSDLVKEASKLSQTKNYFEDIWDYGRSLKHKGYIRESRHRRKFITQNFVPNLKNDWKLLVFGEKIYTLLRATRKNDFRASGSGKFLFDKNSIVDKVLDFAKEMYDCLDVPHIALDVGYDGRKVYLFEFQVILFGTYTLERSPFYFQKENGIWRAVNSRSDFEEIYTESIVHYIEKKYASMLRQ